jgi:hypothetical protein
MLPARKVIFKTKIDIQNTEICEGIHALRLGFELEGGEVEGPGRSEGAADLGKGSDSKAEYTAAIVSKPARVPAVNARQTRRPTNANK